MSIAISEGWLWESMYPTVRRRDRRTHGLNAPLNMTRSSYKDKSLNVLKMLKVSQLSLFGPDAPSRESKFRAPLIDLASPPPASELKAQIASSELGTFAVVKAGAYIRALHLGSSAAEVRAEVEQLFESEQLEWLDKEAERVDLAAYLAKPTRPHHWPLAPQGTNFQRRVWTMLTQIPPGARVTYTELAHALGSPNSARAVASACGRNPIAVLIPCHRVVGSDGALRGYRWGLERKRRLLEIEQGAAR